MPSFRGCVGGTRKILGKGGIDLVTLEKKNGTAYVAERKFASKPIGMNVLKSLRARASAVGELDGYRTVYRLFSVPGYKDGMAEWCGGDVLLFDKGERVSRSTRVRRLSSVKPECENPPNML